MSCLVRRIDFRSGATTGPDREASDLSDARRFEPDGVYAVFATRNGRRVVRLSRHFDRLEDSARSAGFEVSINRLVVARAIARLLDDGGFEEARVRMVATAGSSQLTVSAESYTGPPLDHKRMGVACLTVRNEAREIPHAKRSSWMYKRDAIRSGLRRSGQPEPYEVLLLDEEDRILEGTSSNFFAIYEGPLLRTAGTGVLPGIARAIVLDVATGIVSVEQTAPPRADVSVIREAFLTSASRGVVPIVSIDAVPIGDGVPGPTTASLSAAYEARASELEEPLEPESSAPDP